MSFFNAVRRSHPIQVGAVIAGRRVVSTYNRSTDDSVWGDAWVTFDDGEEMPAIEALKRHFATPYACEDQKGMLSSSSGNALKD